MNTTRPYPSFLFVFAVMFLATLGPLHAQDDDVTECPFFNVESQDSEGIAFALISTDVNATVSGVISRVTLEQTYVNAGDSIIDATYVFPMSSKAAVYGMEMNLDGRSIIAEIRRKDEAQTIFDTANEDGLTATLLEQNRPNVFTMKLANINPGDTLKVKMNYVELLVPREGIYQFVFPNVVGPRFTTEGEPWVTQATVDSLPLSQTALNIDLLINAGMPLDAESTSHDVDFAYQGLSAATSLRTNPGADFIVDYTLDNDDIHTGMLLYEGEEENFFLSMIQPPRPDVPYDRPDREYIFIMDVSGSMRGLPIEISKQMISDLLQDMEMNDRFNIIQFAGGSAIFAPQSVEASQENIDAALEMIDNVSAGGGTHLLPAMQKALALEGTEGYSRTFVILTDGFVTVEKQSYDLIRNNLGEANFFSFGIGGNVNRFIIEGIAYVGEGEDFVVTDLADTDDTADRFKTYLENPFLTNIEVDFEGIEVYDVEPLTTPDVFAESPIIIYGKYDKPANGTLTLSGDYARGQFSTRLNFQDFTQGMEDNEALRYLWARKRIRLMSDYGIASNETDTISIEEEITQLGLKYSLVTEYTSFVAVDSSAILDTNPSNGIGDDISVTDVIDLDETATQQRFLTLLANHNTTQGSLSYQLHNLIPSSHRDLSLVLYDLSGKTIKTYNIELLLDTEQLLDLPDLSSGMYFMTLMDGTTVLDTEKLIISN